MVNQVIVHKHRSDEPVFETIATAESIPPLSLEDASRDVYVPRLGSDDLLHIAAFAVSDGYLLDGLAIAGRHGAPLNEQEAAQASHEITDNLGIGPGYAASSFARDYPGHFVTALFLTSPDMHSLTLRRLGVVETDLPSVATELLSSAWRRVQFA